MGGLSGGAAASEAAAELGDGALNAALEAAADKGEAAHGPVGLVRPREERVHHGPRRVDPGAAELHVAIEARPREPAPVEPPRPQRHHHCSTTPLERERERITLRERERGV